RLACAKLGTRLLVTHKGVFAPAVVRRQHRVGRSVELGQIQPRVQFLDVRTLPLVALRRRLPTGLWDTELDRDQLLVDARSHVRIVQGKDPALIAPLATETALQSEAPGRPHLGDAHTPPGPPSHQVDAPLSCIITAETDGPDMSIGGPGLSRRHRHSVEV